MKVNNILIKYYKLNKQLIYDFLCIILMLFFIIATCKGLITIIEDSFFNENNVEFVDKILDIFF